MGVNNTEVWNNVGLCCFYSSQYDMALGCFDRALSLADDDVMADVWYNIGHVGVSLGDLGLAYQAFKIAVSIDANHGEALNNIAVLEMRRQKFEVAKTCLASSCEVSPFIFEPFYNSGTPRNLSCQRCNHHPLLPHCSHVFVTAHAPLSPDVLPHG